VSSCKLYHPNNKTSVTLNHSIHATLGLRQTIARYISHCRSGVAALHQHLLQLLVLLPLLLLRGVVHQLLLLARLNLHEGRHDAVVAAHKLVAAVLDAAILICRQSDLVEVGGTSCEARLRHLVVHRQDVSQVIDVALIDGCSCSWHLYLMNKFHLQY